MRKHRNVVWTAIGVALLGLVLVRHAAAGSDVERSTYFTFSGPVRLPGVSLGTGTYVFEVVDPSASPGLVRVLSRDRRTAYFTGFTLGVDRPRETRLDASVSFGESAAGVAPPITAWWPADERSGHQFSYRNP